MRSCSGSGRVGISSFSRPKNSCKLPVSHSHVFELLGDLIGTALTASVRLAPHFVPPAPRSRLFLSPETAAFPTLLVHHISRPRLSHAHTEPPSRHEIQVPHRLWSHLNGGYRRLHVALSISGVVKIRLADHGEIVEHCWWWKARCIHRANRCWWRPRPTSRPLTHPRMQTPLEIRICDERILVLVLVHRTTGCVRHTPRPRCRQRHAVWGRSRIGQMCVLWAAKLAQGIPSGILVAKGTRAWRRRHGRKSCWKFRCACGGGV
jgi:hypothetical protein